MDEYNGLQEWASLQHQIERAAWDDCIEYLDEAISYLEGSVGNIGKLREQIYGGEIEVGEINLN